MRRLKSIVILGAIALMVAPMTQSCKKGENDPGISLRSRKARVAGEWKVTEMKLDATSSNTNTNGSKEDWSNTESFTETAYSSTSDYTYTPTTGSANTSSNESSGAVVTHTYTLEKDGKASHIQEYTITSQTSSSTGNPAATGTVDMSYKITAEGQWSFMGKNKAGEYKNKERISFTWLSSTTVETWKSTGTGTASSSTETETETYTSYTDVDETWVLDMLANKEMKAMATIDGTDSDEDTSVFGATTTTTTSSGSSKATASITLTQE